MQRLPIELCIVKEVDFERRVVTVYTVTTGLILANVPYMYPIIGQNMEIMFTPTPGMVAYIAVDSEGTPFILGFTESPVFFNKDGICERKALNTPLPPGTMRIGANGAEVIFGYNGDITIQNTNSKISIEPNGAININCSSLTINGKVIEI